MLYVLNFGSANAGGSPTWTYFVDPETGAALTQPTITEASWGNGAYTFEYDWASSPASSFTYMASLNGAEVEWTENAPAAATVTTVIQALPTNSLSSGLIASVRRRSGMPSASGLFTDAEILAIADEETRSYIVPVVLSEREDYWTHNHDVALVDGTLTYRLPYRAVGGKLRDVYVLDAYGNARSLPRVSGNDLADSSYGFYFEGNQITLVNRGSSSVTRLGVTLRMVYYLRPNSLVSTTQAGVVTAFDAAAKTMTFAACSALVGATSFDVIRSNPGYETLGFDLAGSINVGTTVVTLTGSLPTGLEMGDYVCLPQQTPVPQVPAELHDLLAQRVAVQILKAKNLSDKAAVAESELKTLQALALKMVSPRVDGESQQIINRRGLYRQRW